MDNPYPIVENGADLAERMLRRPPMNRKDRRRHEKATGQHVHARFAPVDLGIKQYKRQHGNDPKRVVYFKTEMHKALNELKGE